MRFVLADGASSREVHAVVHDPAATVADLVDALDPSAPPAAGLVVDGRRVPGHRRLDRAGLIDGATVAFRAGSRRPEPPPTGTVVAVTGGLAAGEEAALPAAGLVVGRDPGDGPGLTVSDPALSRRHALVHEDGRGVRVTDLGSHNGTWVDGRAARGPTAVPDGSQVRMGATQLRIRAATADGVPSTDGRLSGGCTVPFNRPPRALAPDPAEPLVPPERAEPPPASAAVGVVAVAVPVVMALAMMKLFGNPIYGLFALLGPILLVGGAVEGRRRRRRTGRRQDQRFRAELDRFATTLSAAGEAEAARLVRRLPDPAEVTRRATLASHRLWERRPVHDDFLRLRAGTGPVRWAPPMDADRRELDDEVLAVLDDAAVLVDAPVELDLTGGGVIGITGHRSAALAVARSLVVQAAVHHGPSDLSIAVLSTTEAADVWRWASWLPHTADVEGGDRRLVASDPGVVEELLGSMMESRTGSAERDGPTGPVLLLVVDDPALVSGRRSLLRSVLRGGAGAFAGIVIAPSVDQLPSNCGLVAEITDPFGSFVLHRPAEGRHVGPGLAAGVGRSSAEAVARALARFDDPDAASSLRRRLPGSVGLFDLCHLAALDVDRLSRRWDGAGPDPPLVCPLGVGADGTVTVDLVEDGPHALVAGTTGSGKSELLRTLVAGLAVAASPRHLTFVLIDFKGGSAFDQCAELPHTVGLVTDLDEALASRALRSLEAELHYRERLLRSATAGDLAQYRVAEPEVPIPRLVVVVDEFATLAAELPDFVDRLVGVAQRGRSLGVHLVLATQRPAGAVSDHIRANTNLRIALRVQDPAESTDVVGVPDAASLPRRQPGRAIARLGHGEVVTMQTALVSGTTPAGGRPAVELRPLDAWPADESSDERPAAASRATDLARLAQAATAAFQRSGQPAPRRPWLPPLPADVDLAPYLRQAGGADGSTVDFYLVDDPDHQRQVPDGWRPAEGNLLVVGMVGSGTTTALGSLALAAACRADPDRLHLYVLDHGAGDLAPLADLAHTGAFVAAGERERQERLVRFLCSELERRRALPSPRTSESWILVLVDNLAGLRHAWPDAGPVPLLEDLTRAVADGPEVGIHVCVAADRAAAVPAALLASFPQKLLFRPADPGDHATFGIARAAVPTFRPGLAVRAHDGLTVQVARPGAGLAQAVAELVQRSGRLPSSRPPQPIGSLPERVPVASVAGDASVGPGRWFLPLGVGERDLSAAGLVLYEGDHGLVSGPPRSGRTTALLVLAAVAAGRGATVVAVSDASRSPLSTGPAITRAVDPGQIDVGGLLALGGPVLVLIDDAELVTNEQVGELLDHRRAGLHVVAAGRTDALRHGYDHWTRSIRASRLGLLLDPDPDLDGDLLGVRLPRRSPVAFTPGRGWLVGGLAPEVVQVADHR